MSITPNTPYSPSSSSDDLAPQAYMQTPPDLPVMPRLPSLSHSDFHTSREDDYNGAVPMANRQMLSSQHSLPQTRLRVNEDSSYNTPVLPRLDSFTGQEESYNSLTPVANRLMLSGQHTLPQGTLRTSGHSGYNTPAPHALPAGSRVSSGNGYSEPPMPTPMVTETQLDTPMVIPPLVIDRMAQDMGLDDEHHNNLHGFVHLGSRNGTLTQADLGTRTYMLATIYQDMAEHH
ncbi:hypothetical protein BDN71DRAFT_1514629 [Pleurotus eryngii]|uniref:Uncharacterized protein n=1 Tax=Pleurotus eryngii TaxID=5323 RepID=A0A9P5ZI26_PLEER|nr:hypothetical protein BDN71DRAFT_1514629 [Pleurotus eryngii]